jgi:hypothetical protein
MHEEPVDAAERLADYLAGELDADEHAAVEAALARDPALRAKLAHLRRADAALTTLSSPTPPAGFEARLQAALAPELAHQLGEARPATAGEPTGTTPGERIAADAAAAARARREARASGVRAWRWLPAFGGIAASLLLLVVAVTVVGPLGGDDDADVAAGDAELLEEAAGDQDGAAEDAMDAAGDRDAAEEEEAEDGPEAAEDDAVMEADEGETAAGVSVPGPEVVAEGRDLSPTEVDDLLGVPAVAALTTERLGGPEGTDLAAAWTAQLGARSDLDATITSDDADAEGTATDVAPALLALLPAERAAVSGCLTEVLANEPQDGPAAIPAYVELVTVTGEPAVAYVLVVPDARGRFTTPQAWVVARDDCRVLAAAGG